ncbi:MAG: hydroxyacid dehydrogenase [Gemmatimonadota bacterium]
MKIVVYEVEAWERETFERLRDEHEVVYHEEPLTEENAGDDADADVISTFIYSECQSRVLDSFDHLKLIASRSTGVDHIDMDWCDAHDVTVANVPSYGENTVAEHAFALLLALSHNIVEAAERTDRGDFSQDGLRGFDLRGRTLGVVGTGDIGEHALRIGRGFGMELVAFDVVRKEELADEIGFEYVELDELLGRADVVTIHVPLNDATRGMIGPEQFDRMKDGVVLINTARGAIVDVEALTDALADGKVAAAGLDVLPEEPAIRDDTALLRERFRKEFDLNALLANHVLLRQKNVIVTPHSAFNTTDAIQRILDTTVDNIVAFDAGEPENVVSAE